MRKGLSFLGNWIGAGARNKQAARAAAAGYDTYALWSLERTAMILGLPKIGNKNWYAWGSQMLLATQAADGGWHDRWDQGEASAPSSLNFGVESLQFHAGVFDPKLPVDAPLFGIRLF